MRSVPRPRPGRRGVAAITAAITTVAASVTLVAAVGSAAHAAPSTSPTSQATELTPAQAVAQAKASGKAVSVPAATTSTDTLTANPNGTLTLTRTAMPVRKRIAGGKWADLDATLTRTADGTITPTAAADTLTLSGGGTGPLAVLHSASRSLALSLPMTLPTPTLSGATATYAGVLPGVDVRVTADTQGGFSQVLVVHDAKAAANPALKKLTLAAKAVGTALAADTAGNITAKDRSGHAVFTAPVPRMWDSTHATPSATVPAPRTGARLDAATGQPIDSGPSGPGEAAHRAPITVSARADAIDLTPNQALLTAATTVYPVYIDPSWSVDSKGKSGWATVAEQYPSDSEWDKTTAPDGEMQVGNVGDIWAHTLVNFTLSSTLSGATINSATFNITETDSYSCNASYLDVWAPSATLNSGNATWNYWANNMGSTQATRASFAHGHDSTCPNQGVSLDVTSTIKSDVAAGRSVRTFGLTAENESTSYEGWKEFDPATANLTITYDHAPNIPSGLSTSPITSCNASTPTIVGDSQVSLYAQVSDPDGTVVSPSFELLNTTTGAVVTTSGWMSNINSGATATYPVSQSVLEGAAKGAVTEFSWHVRASDGLLAGGWSTPPCTFKFDPTRTGAPQVKAVTSPLTIGTDANFSITPQPNTTPPTSYVYQLNGAAPQTVTAHQPDGTATITVRVTRFTNTLDVTSRSAGGNIGQSNSLIFNATAATPVADQDMTGDGVPDLLAVGGQQHNLPPGLWLANGSTTGTVNPALTDIGANGDNILRDNSPSDFNNAQVITGHFNGGSLQDVLVYYPTGDPKGDNVGGGVVLFGNGDGSVIQAQSSDNANPITAGTFSPDGTYNPIQLANAGHASGQTSPYPDLIGIIPNSTGGNQLVYYPTAAGSYGDTHLVSTPTPTGTDWTNWTITTSQLANNSTAMFMWNHTSGALYLWTGLTYHPAPPGSTDPATVTHTAEYKLSSSWHPGATLSLQAADINADGTPDLWTIDNTGTVGAYLVNLSTTLSATPTTTTSPLLTPSHSWGLTDPPTDASGNPTTATVATTADSIKGLNATGNSGTTWNTGDLFNPDITFDATKTGALTTTGPAVTTTSDFAVSAWVMPPATGGGTVLSQDDTQTSGKTSGFKLWAEPSDNSWRFAIPTQDTSTPSFDVANAGAGTVQFGVWTKLTATVTYQNGTATIKLYLNDVIAAQATDTTPWSATGKFHIGNQLSQGAYTSYFTGQIANVQTWSTVTGLLPANSPGGAGLPQNVGLDSSQLKADFNGDGRDDIAMFYDYGNGHVSLWTMTADANNDGKFGNPVLRWQDFNWGPGTKFVTAGDFNGDGKADIALFYDYGNSQVSIFTLTASPSGDGSFAGPQLRWNDKYWGEGTVSATAGDFNGDGKADIALFYDYGGGHVSLWTLPADPNGFGTFPTTTYQKDYPSWGDGTKFMSAGDYNGDHKTDLALFYDYGGGHISLFTLTADSTGKGTFSDPALGWDGPNWGTGTTFVSAGDYNGDGKTDIALFYDYGGGHVSLFTLTAGAGGKPLGAPVLQWNGPYWGSSSKFLPGGDFNADHKTDLALFYDYGAGHVTLFTFPANASGNGTFAGPNTAWDGPNWGSGTRAVI